jgi:hypothetical protein
MSEGIYAFDDETKALLMQGMSAEAFQASMGLMTAGGDKELAETIRREHEELARDMEAKNRAAEKRRAALVTGKTEPEVPQSTLEQKPVKKKGRKGMKRQEAARVTKQEFIVQPEAREPIAPAQALPEQPEPGTGMSGLTQADLDLIRSVKESHARMRDQFVEQQGTEHPGAYDARILDPRYAHARAQARMQEPSPEYARERLANDPSMMAPQIIPNSDGDWSLSAEAAAVEHRMLTQAAMNPTQQERAITNELNTAAYNGQGNPGYVQQPMPYAQPQMPQMMHVQPPVGNVANTQAFMEATRQVQPAPAQTMPPPAEPVQRVPGNIVQMRPQEVPQAQKPIFDPGAPNRDFESFTEITEWPSHGLFYPEKIYGQALKTVDVFMLSDATDDDANSALTTIMGRRLRGIASPEDILGCDEEYLLYWLRASTYPENDAGLPKMKYDCQKCGRRYRDLEAVQMLPGVSFNDLEFRTEVPPEQVAAMHAEHGYVVFSAYDGRECNVYLKRRKHDRIVDEYIADWETANNDIFPRYRKEALAIASVLEVEDCETMTEKLDYIESYPAAERHKLFLAVLNAQIVTKTFVKVRCPGCGGTATLPYPFRLRNYVASL